MASRERATITDVAAAAGVSRQTVTRAVNDMPGISGQTRDRVLQAARELRYRPSRFGRDLVDRSRRTIGLVVDSLANPYYPELATALVGAAAARGWQVSLADKRFAATNDELLAELGRHVDVVVGYLHFVPSAHLLETLPIVAIDGDPGGPLAVVSFDLGPAMVDLGSHLRAAGVRHPAAVVPSLPDDRAEAFAAAMRPLPVQTVACGSGTDPLTGGVQGAEEIVRLRHSGSPIDAVLAFNDMIGCGLLKGFRRAGLRVPEDIRVAGIDGLSLGTVVTPELTSLALDRAEVARHAVDLAIEIFDGHAPAERARREVSYRLVVRESG